MLNCFDTRKAGDSYGPSPVSGGAPSPPLMMEDAGRPPSGRRSEPFGELLSLILFHFSLIPGTDFFFLFLFILFLILWCLHAIF